MPGKLGTCCAQAAAGPDGENQADSAAVDLGTRQEEAYHQWPEKESLVRRKHWNVESEMLLLAMLEDAVVCQEC